MNLELQVFCLIKAQRLQLVEQSWKKLRPILEKKWQQRMKIKSIINPTIFNAPFIR